MLIQKWLRHNSPYPATPDANLTLTISIDRIYITDNPLLWYVAMEILNLDVLVHTPIMNETDCK